MRGQGRIEEYRNVMGHSGADTSNNTNSRIIVEEDCEESVESNNGGGPSKETKILEIFNT